MRATQITCNFKVPTSPYGAISCIGKLQVLLQVFLLLLPRALLQQGHRQEVRSFIHCFGQLLSKPVGDCSSRRHQNGHAYIAIPDVLHMYASHQNFTAHS